MPCLLHVVELMLTGNIKGRSPPKTVCPKAAVCGEMCETTDRDFYDTFGDAQLLFCNRNEVPVETRPSTLTTS